MQMSSIDCSHILAHLLVQGWEMYEFHLPILFNINFQFPALSKFNMQVPSPWDGSITKLLFHNLNNSFGCLLPDRILRMLPHLYAKML